MSGVALSKKTSLTHFTALVFHPHSLVIIYTLSSPSKNDLEISSYHTNALIEEGAKFKPEKDRYHLFVAYACPWANRALIVRAMKGLEDVIGYTAVHPTWVKTKPDDPTDKHTGWRFCSTPEDEEPPFQNSIGQGGPFSPTVEGCEPNPLFDSYTVRDIYEQANDTDGKYTVPILWDKKLHTIVSNESSEIIQMLNSEFNEFATNPTLDLNPKYLQDEMAAVDEWIYTNLNNGVYRCGFAKAQSAYNDAIEDLTTAFDQVDTILQNQRFIAGDQITLSDIRLFVTLVRFDEVYAVYFKTNTRSVAHTPAILNYCREIYQMPGVKDTIKMDQIKQHYYTSHPHLNPFSVIPKGIGFVKLLEEPHDRDSLHKRAKIVTHVD